VHKLTVGLCTRYNCADARTQLLAMSRTAKMRARPTHLTKGSNPHREVWTHPLANCTLLGACVASIFVKVVVKGPARKASREERTMDKRQALSRSLLKTSLLSPILTLPLSSPLLLSIHLSLHRLTRPSINHFTSFTRTSFNQSSTFSNLPSPSRLPDFATRQASPIHPTPLLLPPLDNTALCFAH
jgi:hypothetical protein